jgi:hypothetical protein
METLIGIGIWAVIFVVWYVKNYPEKFRTIFPGLIKKMSSIHKKKAPSTRVKAPVKRSEDFKHLVETIESICAKDKIGSTDAATMVQAVNRLLEIEPSSGQIWEAYALDSLESAEITCDDCKIPVEKTVKKTGIRIQCNSCSKWLALKNSKITIINPHRPDLEDWEK